jgi:hypothetical protein
VLQSGYDYPRITPGPVGDVAGELASKLRIGNQVHAKPECQSAKHVCWKEEASSKQTEHTLPNHSIELAAEIAAFTKKERPCDEIRLSPSSLLS